ncbi:hypothetical protein [Flavobacterium sp.]|uniref:hypothetical protein n=1 Tax=Flavobacterium sp. TaxID=239 RepID=UPI00121783A5|nr:hypothetical protein [Flavobacterium sp.]RZJ71565.1 MAG: hypothetical protein EOO49_09410 [Flavobacterium sp.]
MFKALLPFLFAACFLSCNKKNDEVSIFINQYDAIRLVSYNHHRTAALKFTDNDLQIENTKFVDDISLNADQSYKIFKVLFSPPEIGTLADCYYPRHILLFYKQKKIIGYYEFCAACGGSEQSQNIKIPSIVTEQGAQLVKIFKEMKLNNNGEDNGEMPYF